MVTRLDQRSTCMHAHVLTCNCATSQLCKRACHTASQAVGKARTSSPVIPSRSTAPFGTPSSLNGRFQAQSSHPLPCNPAGGHLSTPAATAGGGGGGGDGCGSSRTGLSGGSSLQRQPLGCSSRAGGTRCVARCVHFQACWVWTRSVAPCAPPEVCACRSATWWQPAVRRVKRRLRQQRRWSAPRRFFSSTYGVLGLESYIQLIEGLIPVGILSKTMLNEVQYLKNMKQA
jgi:hypothetical protein